MFSVLEMSGAKEDGIFYKEGKERREASSSAIIVPRITCRYR